MNCPKCGAPLAPETAFCANCGAPVSAPAPAPQPAPQPVAQPAPQPIPQQNMYNTYPTTPVYPQQSAAGQIPPEYKPLSPWAYFGYMLLFSIPIVGFICLIVFSVNNDNINRRNFARTYWIILVIGILFAIITAILAAVFGVSLFREIGNNGYNFYY